MKWLELPGGLPELNQRGNKQSHSLLTVPIPVTGRSQNLLRCVFLRLFQTTDGRLRGGHGEGCLFRTSAHPVTLATSSISPRRAQVTCSKVCGVCLAGLFHATPTPGTTKEEKETDDKEGEETEARRRRRKRRRRGSKKKTGKKQKKRLRRAPDNPGRPPSVREETSP